MPDRDKEETTVCAMCGLSPSRHAPGELARCALAWGARVRQAGRVGADRLYPDPPVPGVRGRRITLPYILPLLSLSPL